MSTVGLSFNIGKYSNWGRYNTFSKKNRLWGRLLIIIMVTKYLTEITRKQDEYMSVFHPLVFTLWKSCPYKFYIKAYEYKGHCTRFLYFSQVEHGLYIHKRGN